MRSRPAFVAGAIAILSGIVVAGYPLLLSDSGLVLGLGLLGVGALGAGAIRGYTSLSITGTVVLVLEYLIALFLSGSSFDYLAAAYAVALLLLIEAVDLARGWWAYAPPRVVIAERIIYLVTLLAVGALVAWLAAIAGTVVNSSLLLLVLGALGGVAAIALPLHFARMVLSTRDDS